MIEEQLLLRRSELSGVVASPEEIATLRSRLGTCIPEWFLKMLSTYPLSGTLFLLSEAEDKSGLGVEMEWLSPAQIISEAFEFYPGICAHLKGYFPIGSCLSGSVDYYYLQGHEQNDPPLLRIPHDAVNDEELIESEIEVVCDSLSAFVRVATIES
jgi:hypothetical protein